MAPIPYITFTQRGDGTGGAGQEIPPKLLTKIREGAGKCPKVCERPMWSPPECVRASKFAIITYHAFAGQIAARFCHEGHLIGGGGGGQISPLISNRVGNKYTY